MQVPARITNRDLLSERHAQLVAAATDLFLKQGFHKTTVREIAAAAGWQMGTLYMYISRKEDVLYLISIAIVRDLWDGLQQVEPRSTARETLRAAMEYFFRTVDRKRREIKLLYRESASLLPEHLEEIKRIGAQEREYFAGVIRQGIEKGEFRQANANLMANDIMMLGDMWALKGWALWPGIDFETYLHAQCDLILARLLHEPEC